MSSLLLGFTSYGSAVSVVPATSASTASMSSSSTTTIIIPLNATTTYPVGVTILTKTIIGWLSTVNGATSITVAECSFVAGEPTTTASSALKGYRSFWSRRLCRGIALSSSCRSLINDLNGWFRFLVRVFIMVIAEKLVKIL
jgi:hypothetical protein